MIVPNNSNDPTARPANHDNVMTWLAIGIGLAWLIPGFVGHDPWKPDEAYTFGLVHHILEGGGWVVPMLAGEPFLETSTLVPLIAALFAKLFAFALPAHDAARLAAPLFMALALYFTSLAGRELNGISRGWVAALLLVGSLGLLVRAHQLIPDAALFAGVAIGAYGLTRIPARALTGGVWLGTGTGIGFMAKGLFAPLLFALATIVLLVGCQSWRDRRSLLGACAALAAVLPWITLWPAMLYANSPFLFAEWLMNDDLVRFWTEDFAIRSQLWHYLAILPWYAWPSLPLALWVLWGTRVSRFARPAIQLPVVLFMVTLALLGVCADARELRAMPLLIPLALLATPAIDTLRRGALNAFYWFSVMGFGFFAAVIWIYWSGLELGIPARLSGHLHRMQPAYDSHVRIIPFVFGALYCTAFILLVVRLKRGIERPVVVWAAGTALVWGMLMSLLLGYLDTAKSYRSMAASLAHAMPADTDCVTSRALGESQRAMLHYHAGILTYREEAPARQRACDLLLIQGKRTEPPEIPPGWHQVWEGTRPGEKHEYFWLYAYGTPPPL